MNLTEPQAGSDVGAVRSRAEPLDDGTYAVSGQKIFISWGDHDIADNVCHLVLARLPDGAPGTRGISLFLVPKFLPDADGRPGVQNARAGAVARAQDGPARQPDLRDGVRRATGLADRRAASGHGGDVHDDEQRPARRRGAGPRPRPTPRCRPHSASRASGGRGGRRSSTCRRSSAMPTCGGC